MDKYNFDGYIYSKEKKTHTQSFFECESNLYTIALDSKSVLKWEKNLKLVYIKL